MKTAVVAAPAMILTFGGQGLAPIRIPIEFWRAENDRDAPDSWNSAIVRNRLPSRPDEHVVPGSGHTIFLAPCTTFNRSVVAFFQKN